MIPYNLEDIERTSEAHYTLAKGFEYLPNGDLSVKVYGVPYGGPTYLNGKDLQKERFTEETDIGRLPIVFTKFSHGKHPLFGKGDIGFGKRRADLDDANGRVYEIVLDQRHQYFKALAALVEDNLLGSSSVPLQQTAEKSLDGTWKRWEVTEVTLTPWNVNPDAAIIFEKALSDLQGANMANTTPDTPVTTPVAAETPTVVAETPAVAPLIDQVNAAVDAEVAALAKGLEAAPTSTPSETLLNQVLSELTAIRAENAALQKSLEEVRQVIPSLPSSSAKLVAAYLGKSSAEVQAAATLGKGLQAIPTTPAQPAPAPRSSARTKLPPGAPGLTRSQ